jgi:hypothetical protein
VTALAPPVMPHAHPAARAKIPRVTQSTIDHVCRDETTTAGSVGPAEGAITVMVSDHTNSGRNTARKNSARARAAETGISYTAALRQVTQAAEGRQPRHRWVLTGEVRAWFAGTGWRGIRYPDLYDWLDNDVKPTYDCDWCGEPGDARKVDSSISLTIAAYDPDLSPATEHLFTHKYHATCKPSSIRWARPSPINIPAGPQIIGLPSSARPDQAAEIELESRPLVSAGDDEHDEQAVLLLTARVVKDLGHGAATWLTEFGLFLSQHGFGQPSSLADTRPAEWSLRIETDPTAQWVALRTATVDDGGARHLLLSALDLPTAWVELARRDREVTVVVGPCTSHWDEPGAAVGEVGGELLDEYRDTDPDEPSGCRCAALTADQVDELLDASFVMGQIRVIADEEER